MELENNISFVERDTHNFWHLSHLLDPYMIGHKGFIAGGCFKNILNNEKIKDIDVYFENQEDFLEAVNHFKTLVEENSDKYRYSYFNDKVISFYDKVGNVRIELIRSVYGTPLDIIDNFDFTITKFAYYKKEIENMVKDDEDNETLETEINYFIMHHKDFFEHLATKRLVIDNNLPFPVSSFERSFKYRDYGYKLCRESKIKLLTAINEIEILTEDDFSASLYEGGLD